MSNVTVELNNDAVRELLTSGEVQSIMEVHAKAVAAAAGEGFGIKTTKSPKNRVNAIVFAKTKEARKRQMKDNVLLTALGGYGTGEYNDLT